jgi:hypothetical protein
MLKRSVVNLIVSRPALDVDTFSFQFSYISEQKYKFQFAQYHPTGL